ncbi:MAG: NAD(P)H-hydrate dehydratase [Bacteroidaceae bacterium]|nr:NAD(P)H-hydrate dehydratase [Bacteroidaceae bacterium]
MKILTGRQFHDLDLYTIEHEPVPSIDLMERAATQIAREIMSRWSKAHPVCVFAGPGNNGGDGLAVARLLGSNGYRVRVWLFNVKGHLSPDCQRNRERMTRVPQVELREVNRELTFPDIADDEVVVDALFGTGLNKPISGGFAVVVHKINSLHVPVVSIDVPSGLMCEDNTYNDRNNIIHATLTLTVQLPKLAFFFADNEPFVGTWKCVDIQLSAEGLVQMSTPFRTLEDQEVKAMWRKRPRFAHKGTMGHALLVAGSEGMAGAALLAAKACLRSGAGKLTVHTAKANLPLLQTAVPEAIVHPDRDKVMVTESTLLDPYKAIGIGPGLGTNEATATALNRYLQLADQPIVLDADGINLLAKHPAWAAKLPHESILTPHPRELEGLTGKANTDYKRLMLAQEYALQHMVYVVLKGHHTAICMPSGRVVFCMAGNPGMATAGSGDVLTGLITGLLAQGYEPAEAVQMGVWLHATAGDFAAEALTEECMLASDIVAQLPQAFRQLKDNE